MIGPTLGLILRIGPRLGLAEAPELGVADAVAVAVLVPAEGDGVLPVPALPDGESLACAVADANIVVVAYAVGSVVTASVGWPVFWPASAVGVARLLSEGPVVGPDIKGSFRSVQPDIARTANNITDINAIDLFDNTKIMHL